jgi:FAD synthase
VAPYASNLSQIYCLMDWRAKQVVVGRRFEAGKMREGAARRVEGLEGLEGLEIISV